MHCNLNIFLLDQLNKTYGGQYRQRGRRGPVQYQNEEDYDGSEYLNNTGEGDMIFDRDDRIDEVMNYEHDEENVDLETTKTGEVYIFI